MRRPASAVASYLLHLQRSAPVVLGRPTEPAGGEPFEKVAVELEAAAADSAGE